MASLDPSFQTGLGAATPTMKVEMGWFVSGVLLEEAFMKPIVLIIAVVVASLGLPAFAGEVQSRNITLSNNVVISGTELAPGEYTVQWSETGPNVQIRFLRDGHEIVSVQGSITNQRNKHNSITTRLEDEGHRTLREISFSSATVRLAPENEVQTQ